MTAIATASRLHYLELKPVPETLAVGCRQYQFIQGNHAAGPELTSEIWNQKSGQKANAVDAASEVLDNCWNLTNQLIRLALKNNYAETPTYPQLLITPEGVVMHQLKQHDHDVFGDLTPGGMVARFRGSESPAVAWEMAKRPLEELEQAKFRIQYLNALAAYPDHAVVEFDWNL